MLIRKTIDGSRTVGHDAYWRFHHLLARVGFLRSGYYFGSRSERP